MSRRLLVIVTWLKSKTKLFFSLLFHFCDRLSAYLNNLEHSMAVSNITKVKFCNNGHFFRRRSDIPVIGLGRDLIFWRSILFFSRIQHDFEIKGLIYLINWSRIIINHDLLSPFKSKLCKKYGLLVVKSLSNLQNFAKKKLLDPSEFNRCYGLNTQSLIESCDKSSSLICTCLPM